MPDAKSKGLQSPAKAVRTVVASAAAQQTVNYLADKLRDPDFLPQKPDPVADINSVLEATSLMIDAAEGDPQLATQARTWRQRHSKLETGVSAITRAPKSARGKQIKDLKKRSSQLFAEVYQTSMNEGAAPDGE